MSLQLRPHFCLNFIGRALACRFSEDDARHVPVRDIHRENSADGSVAVVFQCSRPPELFLRNGGERPGRIGVERPVIAANGSPPAMGLAEKEVRFHAPLLTGEQRASAAIPGLNLVGDQQNPVPAAESGPNPALYGLVFPVRVMASCVRP